MTVTTTETIATLVGDGATTLVPVPFAFFAAGDLEVVDRTDATGAETVLVLDTHYAVVGGGGGTGSVLLAAPSAPAHTYVVRRVTARAQQTDYVENSAFPADSHEQALDRAMMVAQEADRDANDALLYPKTDPAASKGRLPSSVARKGMLLSFDAATGKPDVVSPADLDLATVTAFIATLLDDGDAEAARATLGALADPLAARGDLLYEGPDGPARLPGAGTAFGLLSCDADDPVWRTLSALLDGAIGSVARGDILIRGAAAWTRLPAGAAGQVLRTQGAGADPQWADAEGGLDPETTYRLYDDFLTVDASAGGGGEIVTFDRPWRWEGDPVTFPARSRVLIGSDGTNIGQIATGFGTSFLAVTAAADDPTLAIAGGLSGAFAGTFLGLSGALFESTNPADGIYFRRTGSTWKAITRAGGSETETDTGVSASDTTRRTFRIAVSGGGASVDFYIDGTLEATHSTNIPSAELGIAISTGNATSGMDFALDVIALEATRT